MIRIEDEMHRNVGEYQSLIAGSDLATQAKAAERQEAERRELQAKEQVSRERGYWVRVEIMGSHKCGIVGETQSILAMIDPVISPRIRIGSQWVPSPGHGDPIIIAHDPVAGGGRRRQLLMSRISDGIHDRKRRGIPVTDCRF
jgi:hypothetical protein